MLKKLIVMLLLIVSVGCTKSGDDVNKLVYENFNLNNKNISAYFVVDDEDFGSRDGVVKVTSDAFDDYSKADSRLVDEDTYLKAAAMYKEWITPIYEVSFNELESVKYTKVDDVSGKDDLVVYFKNEDTGYMLYVFEDNIIKISDGNDSACYKSEVDLTKTYDTFDDFSEEVQAFNKNLLLQISE